MRLRSDWEKKKEEEKIEANAKFLRRGGEGRKRRILSMRFVILSARPAVPSLSGIRYKSNWRDGSSLLSSPESSLDRCTIKRNPVGRYMNNHSRVVNERNTSHFFLFLFSSSVSLVFRASDYLNGNERVAA